MKPSPVISIRLNPAELAKALDGLRAKNLEESSINSPGKILKATFYYGLLSICDNPKDEPTQESLETIENMLNQKNIKKD